MTFMSEICNKLNMDKEPGFTLVELLITIVVATILLAAGVPAFKDFIKNNRVTAQANDLVSSIQLARSESLKRGTNAVICASKDGKSCANKEDWRSGWIVFSDLNRNNTPDIGTGSDEGKCLETQDCIMKANSGLSSGSTLTAQVGFLCFLATGMSGTHLSGTCSSESPEGVDFTIEANNCEKSQARKISVSQQGHTSVATVACK
jgi:type IV fimbrial biogenesis protein FimT